MNGKEIPTQEKTKTKAVLVSRHELNPVQKATLEKANVEIVKIIPQLPTETSELKKLVEELKKEGIELIIAVALPIPLILQLKQLGMRVVLSKQKAIATVNSMEEAQRIATEKPNRFILATGSSEKSQIRVMEFEGFFEIEEVKVIEKPFALP